MLKPERTVIDETLDALNRELNNGKALDTAIRELDRDAALDSVNIEVNNEGS